MPGAVRPVSDERGGFLAYLSQQRDVLRLTAFGLTDDQARATPSASELCVGGLIKHLGRVERGWSDIVLQRQAPFDASTDWTETFRLGPDDTLRGVLSEYEQAASETDEVIAGIADLGQAVPVPHDTPRFPAGVQA
jgi:hypothetical protein